MKKGIVLIVILSMLASAITWIIGAYNTLVRQEENVERCIGDVNTAYQKRADLIPNIVESVKAYAEYEQGTLAAVVEARSHASQTTLNADNLSAEQLKAFQEAQDEVSGALSRLLVTVERYPDLKASHNFMDLNYKLEGCENEIANARRNFNSAANSFNTTVRKFPSNVIAKFFNFEKKPYFEAKTGAEDAPSIGGMLAQ